MKLTRYDEILKMGKEAINAALAPIRANHAKNQCMLTLSEVEEKILSNTATVHELCAEHPLNVSKVIDALDEVSILERRKTQIENLIKDLFGE
jgi:hypothetical protein